jgi:hypothetical protein
MTTLKPPMAAIIVPLTWLASLPRRLVAEQENFVSQQ